DFEAYTFEVLPEPEFSLSYNTSSCDQTFAFSITATNPAINITDFIWHWGDGKSDTTSNPGAVHIYMNRNGYLDKDEYSGTVTAISDTECSFTREFTVTLLKDVSASFLMDKKEGCGPLTVVFDDVSLGATSSRWYYREKSPSIGAWIPFDGIDTT